MFVLLGGVLTRADWHEWWQHGPADPMRNSQIWHHQKPYNAQFHWPDSTRNVIFGIHRKRRPFWATSGHVTYLKYSNSNSASQKTYTTWFHWSESTKNEISWIYSKTAIILNHFRSCDLSEIFKFKLCIIKNPIKLDFIDVRALEVRFHDFTAKRRPFWATSSHMTHVKYSRLNSPSSKTLQYPVSSAW